MKIIVIDDEIAALNTFLYGIVDRAEIECNMFYHNPMLSIDYVKNNKVDVAFLDINMPDINGVELAEKLINEDIRLKIIFISGFSQDEQAIRARIGNNLIGFCHKPYDTDKLNRLLISVMNGINYSREIIIKTFGAFDLFINGRAIKFSSSKGKELLALLVDNRSGYINMDYVITALWPDKDIKNSKRLYRDAVCKLRKDLKGYNLNILECGRAQLRLIPDNIRCDYWDYLKAKTPFYQGVYMAGYDWSIETQSALDEIYRKEFKY